MPPRSNSSCSQSIGVFGINDDNSYESAEEFVFNPPSMKRKGNKPGKSIRFSEKNQTFPVPHLDDIGEAAIAEIWYNAAEYSEIKSSYQLTLFMMENGELKETDEHTSRGLEYRTQQGAWARYENKRDAYNAVLDEQDRQWKADKDDHDALARIYLQHSTKCAVAASERGDADAKEAKEICQDIIKRRKVRRKKSGKDAPIENNAPVPEKVRQMLREQSFSRRGQIRDDIEKQQAKALKKDKRTPLTV
jgi:polyhydroxyalkanoate synthesis regulator phasin